MDEHQGTGPGVPGQSARREYDRRRERRQQNAPAKPKLVAAIFGPSADEKKRIAREKQWAIGAEGEEMLAARLAKMCPEVPLLHDRGLPRSRANIDHIAIAASGVYVIDTKRYRGKIEVLNPIFGKPKLRINGRDQTKLVDGLAKQVATVQASLREVAPDVPVHGCLCFMPPPGFAADDGLPLLRTLKIRGYPLYYPRRLAKRLNRPGELTSDEMFRIHSGLGDRLPPA